MKFNALFKNLVVVAILGASPVMAQMTGFEGIETLSFQRSVNDITANLNRFGNAANVAQIRQISAVERLRYDYFSGNWVGVGETLKQMPVEMGERTYDKMLTDLTSRGEPFMQQEDVIGLIRANPTGWNAARLQQLGQLVKACVAPMQQAWLEKQLKDGIGGLGGNDPATRLNAGRMLIHANFPSLAVKFLPPADGVNAISDQAVREEVANFLKARAEADALEKQQGGSDMARQLAIITDPQAAKNKVRVAKESLLKLMTESSQGALESVFNPLFKENPDVGFEMLTELVKKYGESLRFRNYDLRQQQLHSLHALAMICVENVPANDDKWKTLLSLMAEHWLKESEASYLAKGTVKRMGRLDAVPPSELAVSAPSDKWLAALPQSQSDKVVINIIRSNMLAGGFDKAASSIVELFKVNRDAAMAAAEEFLLVWGERHDPNIPDAMRQRYGLPEDSYISVTPIMIERNIIGLSRVLKLFREAGIQYGDSTKLVNAFDAVYGRAETYKLEHIEMVFGPVQEMPESLTLQLLTKMCASLGKEWRTIEMQKQNLTRRDESQTLDLVRGGYTAAIQMVDRWTGKNTEGYRVTLMGGLLNNDWADFEYFQKLDSSDNMARMTAYRQKFTRGQNYFAKAASGYAKSVGQESAANYTVDVYVAWFNSLLGINSIGDVNLSKPVSRAGLMKIRDSIRSMPKDAADAHIGLFARYINSRMQATQPALHEDLKYKFLASSLLITQDNPFTMQAQQQVDYYNELLSEIRLQINFDGPTTVGRDQDFGLVLSVIHTEGMGRMAKLKQHLSNTLPPDSPARRQAQARNPFAPKVLRMTEVQGPRDALELSIHEALDPSFEIQSITFSRPDVQPRATDAPGWQQTVLAYIQVRVKDSSVDRVPPIELDLSFLDLGGPVTIPVESSEALLKVQSEGAAARPANNVEVTQTLDTRGLLSSGTLSLHVKASASGLVPELDQILNLDGMKPAVQIKSVAANAGAQVREINSWAGDVRAISDREWTVVLDVPEEVREGNATSSFTFPVARSTDTKVTNQRYVDINLVPVTTATTEIGIGQSGGGSWIRKTIIGGAVVVGLAIVAAIAFVMFRKRESHAPVVHARDVFKMPENVDGFVVVSLLNGMVTSPLVNFADADKAAVRKDIDQVQQAIFTSNEPRLNTSELKEIARKWLAKLG